MFCPVIAHQGGLHLSGRALVDSLVTQFNQLLWIALTGQDRIDNAQSGHPGNIAHCVVEVEVHLLERFLHMLDFRATGTDQIVRMPV